MRLDPLKLAIVIGIVAVVGGYASTMSSNPLYKGTGRPVPASPLR